MEYVLGIDIGGTNLKYGIVEKTGKILYSNKVKTDQYLSFSEFVSFLREDLSSRKYLKQLNSIGVGAPNANPVTGKIEQAPNLQWNTVDIVDEIKSKFNKEVMLDNDANIAALGELFFGAGKGKKNTAVITLGTGVGVGLIVNGSIYHGSHFIGAEAGHMIIGDEGRQCTCGGIDHLECYLSSSGFKQTAKKILNVDLRFREIKERYLANDTSIYPVIDYSADILAKGMANMYAILCPELIILSGGVSTLGESFAKRVEDKLKTYVYAPFGKYVNVQVSKISAENGAIIGAASLCFEN